MTKETLCTYEQCSRLKGLGFDVPCWCVYHKAISGRKFLKRCVQYDNFNAGYHVSVPTQTVAHRWLRETKKILIVINPQKNPEGAICFNYSIFDLEDISPIGWSYELYKTYEEAMCGGLDYAIECAIIQNRKQTVKL